MSQIIPASEFVELLRRGAGCCVLDVRAPAEVTTQRLEASCFYMPVDALDVNALRKQFNDPSRPLYILCKGGARAARAAQTLQAAGLTHTVIVKGGLDACVVAGAETTSRGPGIPPLNRQALIAAGSLVIAGLLLGIWAQPVFLLLPLIVGAGLVYSGKTGWRGMQDLLALAPWNREKEKAS